LVAEKTVDLLDRVLGHQTPRLRQGPPDHRNRQRCTRHDPERRPGQRINPLGMNVVLVKIVKKPADILQLPTSQCATLSKSPSHPVDTTTYCGNITGSTP
jgi:hypothetical protein